MLGLHWGLRADRAGAGEREVMELLKFLYFPPEKCMPGAIRLNTIENLGPSV